MNLIDLQSIIIEKEDLKNFSSSLDGLDGLGPKLKKDLINILEGLIKLKKLL